MKPENSTEFKIHVSKQKQKCVSTDGIAICQCFYPLDRMIVHDRVTPAQEVNLPVPIFAVYENWT